MSRRLLQQLVSRQVGVGDPERAGCQNPALLRRITPQIAQALQCVSAALRGALRHANGHTDLGKVERGLFAAEGFENGQRLLHGLVEERIAIERLARPVKAAAGLM